MEWLAEGRMVWYLGWCAGIAGPVLGPFHRAAERELGCLWTLRVRCGPSLGKGCEWGWWRAPCAGTCLVAKPSWQRGCPSSGVSARAVSTSLVWCWMSRLLEATSHGNQVAYLRKLNIYHKCFPELLHPVNSKHVSSWETSIFSVTHGIL